MAMQIIRQQILADKVLAFGACIKLLHFPVDRVCREIADRLQSAAFSSPIARLG